MEYLLRRHPGLATFPRVDLGVRPTPVEEHEFAGLTVLVKRDDLTSPHYGGNKARPLQFLLALPARRFLTYSTLGAHHAYATAVHSAILGIPTAAILLRMGPVGRCLPRLREVCSEVVEVAGPLGAALATTRLWTRGTRIISPGCMSPRGALGYLTAALELSPVPSRIYVPLGTGTTASGLLAGLMLRRATTEVVAVRVAAAAAGLPALVWSRARRAIGLLRRHDATVSQPVRGGVRLRVVAAEGAYGVPTASSLAAVEAARPLRLEPTYTGKTLAVLLAERANGAMFLNTYGWLEDGG